MVQFKVQDEFHDIEMNKKVQNNEQNEKLKNQESQESQESHETNEIEKYEIPMLGSFPDNGCMKAYLPWRWKYVSTPLNITCFTVQHHTFTVGELIFFMMLILLYVGTLMDNTIKGSATIPNIGSFLVFLFGMHNSPLLVIMGIPFERALSYHRKLGVFFVLGGLWHGTIALHHGNPTGYIYQILLFLIFLTSIDIVRRKFFELFMKFHVIFFIGIILAGASHNASGVVYGGLLWLIDITLRMILMKSFTRSEKAEIILLETGIIKIRWNNNNFVYNAGQYVWICIPEISRFQFHPFSLSSAPHDEYITIHIRVLGDWTRKLYELSKNENKSELKILIDGPVGKLNVNLDDPKLESLLMICGGIGITPLQSITNAILEKPVQHIKHIFFVWSVRDRYMTETEFDTKELRERFAKEGETKYDDYDHHNPLPKSFVPVLVKPSTSKVYDPDNGTEWDDGILVHTEFYLTKVRLDKAEFNLANIHPELQTSVKFGVRPDLKDIFARIDKVAKHSTGKVAVMCCGPQGLVDDARRHASQYNYQYHEEVFLF